MYIQKLEDFTKTNELFLKTISIEKIDVELFYGHPVYFQAARRIFFVKKDTLIIILGVMKIGENVYKGIHCRLIG